MPSIRSLRLSRGMTMVDLALAAGVPARTLGAIEHGLLHLDLDCAARFAAIFGLAPDQLCATERNPSLARREPDRMAGLRRAAPPLAAALISGILLIQSPLAQRQPASMATPAVTHAMPGPAASPRPARPDDIPPQRAHTSGAFAALSATTAPPTPTPTVATPSATAAPPAPTPTPMFRLDADGPHGCPLIEATGTIVMTQGYGEGTHAPAAIWGALDLAIDGDGDGDADPGATDGVTIVATHDGVARECTPTAGPAATLCCLSMRSLAGAPAMRTWPVSPSRMVRRSSPCTPLGVVGSTGMATGPHLHYEVRHGGVNLDPSSLIECVALANR